MDTDKNKAKPAAEAAPADADNQVRVNWNTASMTTSYANVANVSSTREEFTLLFGTNQTVQSASRELTVELTDRVILNPYAAKRLMMVLDNVIKAYEQRFGALPLE